ncbi:MAG: metallophosphatase family protein [Gemmataceae bacterium]|nr:metallophosphatase family protein [Gemmataceae bacterium]
MRIGILADTHDQLKRTVAAVELLCSAEAEVLVHCGDLTGPEIVATCATLPAYFVFGNNDADNVPALRQAMADADATCLDWGGLVTLAGKRIAIVHGHLPRDLRPLLAERPDYLLSGHSHIPSDRREGPTRRINPGALHRAEQFTVALLDLAEDALQFLTIPR